MPVSDDALIDGSKHRDGDVMDTDRNVGKDVTNYNWANAMSRVLQIGGIATCTPILSKVKSEPRAPARDSKVEFEVVDERGMKTAVKREAETGEDEDQKTYTERKRQKREWDNMGRVKPNILTRNREHALAKIATRGVVLLFNAVRERQKTLDAKLRAAGGSEFRREKAVKSLTKGDFLDILKNKAKNIDVDEVVEEKVKEKEESKPVWSVLHEDFMLGAKMKDWDKESEDSSEEKEPEEASGTSSESE